MGQEVRRAFDDWKAKANDCGLLETALHYGAVLRRVGGEQVGPCPACGGKDRFSVNEGQGVWNCRGAEGGADAISLAMHVGGLSFMEACESLSGEPPPRGEAKPLSEAERATRERQRAEREKQQAARDAAVRARRAKRVVTAGSIWGECAPIAGTLAERYLIGRGIPVPPLGWPDVLGYHSSVVHELLDGFPAMPALIARVDNVVGEATAIWRIFLDRKTGQKIGQEPAKVGMGAAAGGAVRVAGAAPRISVAEGLETALAAWTLVGYSRPVWATLSTSGMIGFEPPMEVERVSIFPDGDQPMKRQGERWVPVDVPPGRAAALSLYTRLTEMGIACSIEPEPGPGRDYLDVLANVIASDDAA